MRKNKYSFNIGLFVLLFLASFVSAAEKGGNTPWEKARYGAKHLEGREKSEHYTGKGKNFTHYQIVNRPAKAGYKRIHRYTGTRITMKSPDTLGTIMGTVTDIYGNPLEGVGFMVHDLNGGGYSSSGWQTNSLGQYVISGADWPLEFTSCKLETENSIGYIDEWYNNKYDESSADIISVTYPDTIKNINFELEIGGCISGYVTSAEGPLENASIGVFDATTYEWMEYVYADTTGYYFVGGLQTGNYKLKTWNSQGYIDEWYNNKSDFETADPVNVTVPDTTESINFELEIGGYISGYVTSAEGPLENVWVDVYDATTSERMGYGYTNATGYYFIGGLRTGSYKLEANGQGYIDKWYNNKSSFETADPVNVTVPDTTKNINFELELGGCISGYVTSAEGPLEDGYINVYDVTTKENVAYSETDSTGYYIANGLPSGTYKVKTWNYDKWVDLYWNNKLNWNSADVVNVTAPDTVKDINFTLYVGGKIKGNVCTAGGPIEGVGVIAFNINTGEDITNGGTDLSGNYTIHGLPTGYCKILALPNIWGEDTVNGFEWYNNKNDWWSADSIYISAPDSVLNINFLLEEGGYITGTVNGNSKLPLSGAEVAAWWYLNEWCGSYPFFADETDANGKYLLRAIGTGSYKVSAGKSGYGTLWYNQKPDSTSANFVSVVAPNITPNIDFNLVGIEERGTTELSYSLQAMPNPSLGSTIIKYYLPEKTKISLCIYNICGALVKILAEGTQEAGSHSTIWDKLDTEGKKVSSGIYFCKISADKTNLTKKLIFVR